MHPESTAALGERVGACRGGAQPPLCSQAPPPRMPASPAPRPRAATRPRRPSFGRERAFTDSRWRKSGAEGRAAAGARRARGAARGTKAAAAHPDAPPRQPLHTVTMARSLFIIAAVLLVAGASAQGMRRRGRGGGWSRMRGSPSRTPFAARALRPPATAASHWTRAPDGGRCRAPSRPLIDLFPPPPPRPSRPSRPASRRRRGRRLHHHRRPHAHRPVRQAAGFDHGAGRKRRGGKEGGRRRRGAGPRAATRRPSPRHAHPSRPRRPRSSRWTAPRSTCSRRRCRSRPSRAAPTSALSSPRCGARDAACRRGRRAARRGPARPQILLPQGCACSQDVIDLIVMSGGTADNLRAAMKMAQSGNCADGRHGGPIIDVCTGSPGCPPP